jgi:hypothetical protein
MHIDEVILSHTNENEYNSFVSNKKNEALKDRMILVKVPYNLRVTDEVRIYEKLLGDSALKGVHTAPHTLRVASMFAILTRLEPSKKAGLSLMKKLKLYDGDTVEGFTSKDVKELQDEAHREGMMGISPRYIRYLHRVWGDLAKLSAALAEFRCKVCPTVFWRGSRGETNLHSDALPGARPGPAAGGGSSGALAGGSGGGGAQKPGAADCDDHGRTRARHSEGPAGGREVNRGQALLPGLFVYLSEHHLPANWRGSG